MAVVVDSGPISATDKPLKIPREKWGILMRARRDFLRIRLEHDCRCLVEFVDDAEIMYADLGFKNPDDMVRNGYDLEPDEISVAIEWLRINHPDEELPLEQAKKNANAELMVKTKPAATHAEAGAKGGRGNKAPDNVRGFTWGNQATYLASRLKRDRPDIAAAVERGEFSSMRSAAIAAGIVRVKTPLENLQAAWKKTNEEDRKTFLTSISAAFL